MPRTKRAGAPPKKTLSRSQEPAFRKRSRKNTIQTLLDAALRVFSKYGYDAATTRLIARESGVNESLIHRYFKSKEGLLRSLIDSFYEKELAGGFRAQYPGGDSFLREILNYCSFRLDLFVKHRSFFKVIIYRALVDPKLMENINRLTAGSNKILLDRLAEFQRRGMIRPEVNLPISAYAINMLTFSTCMLGHVVLGYDRAKILKNFEVLAKDYAAGLSANHFKPMA